MKQQNILLCVLSLFSLASSNPIDNNEINLDVEITESHIRDYKQYFNCENPKLCEFICYTALSTCWDNSPTRWNKEDKYSHNDCWNLSNACNTINTGVVPEYKDYKTFKNYFPMNSIDNTMRNPAGVEIPYDAYRCNLYYDGIDQSYCNSHRTDWYFSDCFDQTPEEMYKPFEEFDMRIKYCAMYKEYEKFDEVYVTMPTESDIHCYTKYFYLYDEDEDTDEDEREYRLDCNGSSLIITPYGNNEISVGECRRNVELCSIKYPAEDCETLDKVCDAMKTNEMPDFVVEQYNSILSGNSKTSTVATETTTIDTVATETIVVAEPTETSIAVETTTSVVAEPTETPVATETTTTKPTKPNTLLDKLRELLHRLFGF